MAKHYLAVMVGGALGSLARYGVSAWIAADPWQVLGINWLGCFLLGFLNARAARTGMPEWVRVGLGTGVLGGFTTFSTFSVGAVNLLHADRYAEMALYVAASLAGGVLLAWAGLALGRRGGGAEPAREVTS
ncbi:fluoride efflux transporter FluC [Tumebacillus flagellatus]|uniref:Fluoride-specific ion channel FluC n=1 Tax=Tumebacillus flagellatus TaxID=1157490 RepID=A0A074M891_9BACL|nr:CrcB family protein [Tumebacillus flagellatus]KEO82192.1 hypothetical protein EL26_16785 [Tumebacillus flagellatus]